MIPEALQLREFWQYKPFLKQELTIAPGSEEETKPKPGGARGKKRPTWTGNHRLMNDFKNENRKRQRQWKCTLMQRRCV